MTTTPTTTPVTAPTTVPFAAARTVADLDRHGTPSHEVYTAGFYGSDRDFVVRGLLGKASRGGADAGEVLATIAGIDPDDGPGWVTAWTALGRRLEAVAADCSRRGHRVSAARAHLRAANYLATAVNALTHSDDAEQLLQVFRAHRGAWVGFVATTAWPVERVDIPYEDTSLPGWLFRPDGSGRTRPTLVANNGSDGALSGCWCGVAEGGLERGYNVLLFDGPGQQSMLFERDVPFRPDWEKVLTPVVDFLLERDDVDPARLGVYGVSQGGYWVPRALAFEHRFAAAAVDGGAVDVGRSWFAHLPPPLLDLYRRGETAEFDRVMASAMAEPGARAERENWRFRARPYGVAGYSAVLDTAARYALHDLAKDITTPLWIADPDGEQFFPGQSAELAALVGNATLARFTQDEGASYHCQPLARELTEQRVLDWLDEQLRGGHT